MVNFVNCNSRIREDLDCFGIPGTDYKLTEKQYLEELRLSIESGLLPDIEKDIFIREGHGALVGYCPDNCHTLEELLKYTSSDSNRQKVTGAPLTKKEWKDIYGTTSTYSELQLEPYFPYRRYVSENGYDLVIGPGAFVNGQTFNKAVYCRNYLNIIEFQRLQKELEGKGLEQKVKVFSLKEHTQ